MSGGIKKSLVAAAQTPLRALLWAAARLPEPVARAAADVTAFTARSLIRYRRRIVRRNLRDCFPDMSGADLKHTEKMFYRFLADYFFETIALPALSEAQISRRIEFQGLDLLAALIGQRRDIVLYTSHYGNWEYVTALAASMRDLEPVPVIYSHVYRHLKSRFFNNYFLKIRSRFNVSVEMKSVMRTLVGWRRDDRHFIMGFLSDQKPGGHTRPVTVDFLHRPTPFIEGTEILARKMGCAVVYADMHCQTRGHYKVVFRLMTRDASSSEPGWLTARYAALLSESIRRNPPFYLWSHNRWRLRL